jgi:hypothetical protein
MADDEKKEKKEKVRINFVKIAENALTTLVAAVFIGACVIVWNGATSVNEKVQKTEQNLSGLIDNLSEKLAKYETQLSSQSNQLQAISRDLTNVSRQVSFVRLIGGLSGESKPPTANVQLPSESHQVQTEQRARQADIFKDLQKK